MSLTYCIVNTDGRAHLRRCLDAIRNQETSDAQETILLLDNASTDGSTDEVEAWLADNPGWTDRLELIVRSSRHGKAENDSLLLERSRAEFCLLLNEDSELLPGAAAALLAALRAEPDAGAAGAQLLDPSGQPQPCAWRLPSLATALAGAVFAHRIFTVESSGTETRQVGWAQSAAMLVRREAAEQVDYLDPAFFVYSDETDFCKRLGDAGWQTLFVPASRAIHREQLANDRSAGTRRLVEFHRNRDLYMRKHHGRAIAAVVRLLHAWPYLPRALAALVLPGRDAGWFWTQARLALRPRGEGIREAATG